MPETPSPADAIATIPLSAKLLSAASRNASIRIASSAPGDTVPNHLFRIDDLVKALLVDVTRLERGFLQGQPLFVRLMGDGRGLVVADLRNQRGHQHQRAVDHLVNPLPMELRPLDREASQLPAGVAEDPGRMQKIVDDDRPHRAELEITLAAGKGDRIVLADHR